MPPTTSFESARTIIQDAIGARAFPGAVIEIGRDREILWRAALGRLTYEPDALPADESSVYDLASLTKVIATTTLAMRSVDARRLDLDAPISGRLPDWRGDDRATVAIRDLLAHSSGLTSYLPFYRDYTGRGEFERAISTMPLEYVPRTQSIYSDLGFILLGFILEDVEGSPLAESFDRASRSIGLVTVRYNPPPVWRPRTAPTEVDPWRGRLLTGEVHDENAWALGGVAGHAGLFSDIADVGKFAQAMLRSLAGEEIVARPETVRHFIRKTAIPGSSRALGWDTMLPSSSCGTRMSARAFGHTGFTGTSLWIDPERTLYVALLTNRVHPTRANQGITAVRRAVHDAVVGAVDRL